MEVQYIIVALIVAAAAAFFAYEIVKKARAFRPRSGECGDDCGCGSTSKKAVQ